MTMNFPGALAVALLLAATLPGPVLAQAQEAMPRRDSGPYDERRAGELRPRGPGAGATAPFGGQGATPPFGGQGFAGLTEAGRETMRAAMRANRDDARADRAAVQAARERMLVLLDAERLDTGALRRAMDDEREIANTSRERAQAALLAGFARLTPADRRAFVADARAMKGRMEARFRQFRERGLRRD